MTDWEKAETLEKWRENWAKVVNRELERLEIDERISHLSLKAQGIDREPTKHMGPEAWNLERKGIKTEIGNENRDIMKRNVERRISPEITAEYMYELKQCYCILDKEITTTNQQVANARHEIQSLKLKSDKIKEDTEHIFIMRTQIDKLKIQRMEMKPFSNKRAINEQITYLENSCQQAENYFNQSYNIPPEQATEKVKRFEYRVKNLERIQEQRQDKLTPLEVNRNIFVLEYQKQKLLAEINPNGQRVKDKLIQLDKENHLSEKLAQDRITRLQSERNIDIITKSNFQEILKGVQHEQAEALIKLLRERERAREYVRVR